MSLVTVTLDFLSLGPKVTLDGERLVARTSTLVQILWLGIWRKEAVVDRTAEVVTIQKRLFWFFSWQREVQFANIARIDYSFSGIGNSVFSSLRSDQMERFVISLVLHNRKMVKLFAFSGEGSFATGWSGVIFRNDSMIDFAGDQEGKSLSYVKLLKEFTGKTLT